MSNWLRSEILCIFIFLVSLAFTVIRSILGTWEGQPCASVPRAGAKASPADSRLTSCCPPHPSGSAEEEPNLPPGGLQRGAPGCGLGPPSAEDTPQRPRPPTQWESCAVLLFPARGDRGGDVTEAAASQAPAPPASPPPPTAPTKERTGGGGAAATSPLHASPTEPRSAWG